MRLWYQLPSWQLSVPRFLMMTAANAGQLSGEQRLEQSNYNLSALAGEGRETLPEKPLQWSLAWRDRTGPGNI